MSLNTISPVVPVVLINNICLGGRSDLFIKKSVPLSPHRGTTTNFKKMRTPRGLFLTIFLIKIVGLEC